MEMIDKIIRFAIGVGVCGSGVIAAAGIIIVVHLMINIMLFVVAR